MANYLKQFTQLNLLLCHFESPTLSLQIKMVDLWVKANPRMVHWHWHWLLQQRALETAIDSNVCFKHILNTLALKSSYLFYMSLLQFFGSTWLGQLIIGSNQACIQQFKQELSQLHEMTYLKLMTKFLGVQVLQTFENIMLHQSDYARWILATYWIQNCSPSHILLLDFVKLSNETHTNLGDYILYQ